MIFAIDKKLAATIESVNKKFDEKIVKSINDLELQLTSIRNIND